MVLAMSVLAACTTGSGPKGSSPSRTPPSPIVVVSGEEPAFQSVARELVRQGGSGVQLNTLRDRSSGQGALLRALGRNEAKTIVAIGLPAAQLARQVSGKRVVFCQVFNYDEAGLRSPAMAGVSAVPPLHEPFRMWKAIDPRLERIGVITGPRLNGLVNEARAAARAAGVELVHVEVGSDKETRYAFRRLLPRIDGLWLVPDNRVLSAGVIHDLLNQAVREGRQVLGFRHELLALGALLSVESDPADVAAQVLARARDTAAPGGEVVALTRADVRVNRALLRSLGLTAPVAGLADAR